MLTHLASNRLHLSIALILSVSLVLVIGLYSVWLKDERIKSSIAIATTEENKTVFFLADGESSKREDSVVLSIAPPSTNPHDYGGFPKRQAIVTTSVRTATLSDLNEFVKGDYSQWTHFGTLPYTELWVKAKRERGKARFWIRLVHTKGLLPEISVASYEVGDDSFRLDK